MLPSSSPHTPEGSPAPRERPTDSDERRPFAAQPRLRRYGLQSAPQPLEHRLEILRGLAFKQYALTDSRMRESQRPRMQHRARRFDLGAVVIANIDTLTDQGMAELGEVNANLMLSAGLQAALDECRARKRLDRPHVRDRALAVR